METALFDAGANAIQVGRQRDMLKAMIAKRESRVYYRFWSKWRCHTISQVGFKDYFSPVIIFSAKVINPRLHANSIDEASWQETIHINLNEPFPVV